MLSKSKLKLIYNDILRGYSPARHQSQSIFIKHLNSFDVANFDLEYDNHFEEAKQKGLLTSEELEKVVISRGLWFEDNNKQINKHKDFIDRMKLTRSKLFREYEIQSITNQIDEEESKLKALEDEKSKLLEFSAENYASKKLNEYCIFCSLFKTKQLDDNLFTPEEFNELSDQQLFDLCNLYNEVTRNFVELVLKRIALCGFFLNFFYICNDNPHSFYGKPVVELTFFQAELFGFGRYFKHILTNSEGKIPDDLMDDPERLIQWHEGGKNFKQATQNKDPSSLVGLSQKDRERFGIQNDPYQRLIEAAKKRGGSLGFRDILDVKHGRG